MWFIGVEVEQETSAPTPKKNPGSAPAHVDEISEFESERTVSKVRKKKDDFWVVLPYSVKWTHEISKFHVAGMQQWLRNLQKSMMQL